MRHQPLPIPIHTPRDAEIAARDWLKYIGMRDVILGPGTMDEGVDVSSATIVAQVKSGDTPTGRPVIQQIFGVASLLRKKAIVFSVSRFTNEAADWAERARVALFRIGREGAIRPDNELARRMTESAKGGLTGWSPLIARLERYESSREPVQVTCRFRTGSGRVGFWGIWLDGQGHVRFTSDLAGTSTRPGRSVRDSVETIAAAVRSIGGSFWDGQPTIHVGAPD